MTLGRTSPFSKPLFPILTVILLAGFLPGVRAACWFSENTGNEQCDTPLSTAARAAIALAIFLFFLTLFLGTIAYRRRRNAQADLAFTRQIQGGQYGYNGGLSPFPPQYPPQTYGGSPSAYYPTMSYVSPAVFTPQYAPPPGVPPISSNYYQDYDNKGV